MLVRDGGGLLTIFKSCAGGSLSAAALGGLLLDCLLGYRKGFEYVYASESSGSSLIVSYLTGKLPAIKALSLF